MQCDEKTGSYPSGAKARNALSKIRRTGGPSQGSKPTRAYPCDECGRYHLTSDDYVDKGRKWRR